MDRCPTCGEALKISVFGKSNELLQDRQVRLINEYAKTKAEIRCNRCGDEAYRGAVGTLLEEKNKLSEEMRKFLPSLIITTIHSPHNWNYNVLGIITAQTTTGTGAFSEITSTFTDFFGTQSKTYNNKLKDGEELCKSVLRKQAFDLGAHAIVATDIDYAEVGGEKGMLMVCMSGTAVTLKNLEILGGDYVTYSSQLGSIQSRIQHLSQYDTAAA
ncbi:YbjQ family protein [Noviherbaspirillum pedocola]|uniref:Heavy metal-binding domain-containing protein n=1 Tax=Noviherbaspirillum pedocola TaxID=2801341 RepID=A0A934W9N8_9BURK|nr:heavy metal-binding domain-containing protein [Noviherbaspirillum pedocola]MBK4737349.1 heavy metal-binding domain-containing protein [Noviherbaspirillum pedocola]